MKLRSPALQAVCFGVLFLFLFWLPFVAFAQSTSPLGATQSGPRTVDVRPGPPAGAGSGPLNDLLRGRTYIPPGSGTDDGSRLLRDLLRGPGPAGPVDLTATRRVPWAAIARGVGRAVPYVGTVVTIAELLESIRCKPGGDYAICDAGQPEQPVPQFCTPSGFDSQMGGDMRRCAASSLEAAQKLADEFNAKPPVGTYHRRIVRLRSCGTGGLQTCYDFEQRYVPGPWGPSSTSGTVSSGTILQCPDAPGSTYPEEKGPDGLCPGGALEPSTETDVEDKTRMFGDKSKATGAIQELDRLGIPVTTDPPVLSGPDEQSAAPRTVTSPDGSGYTEDVDYPFAYSPWGYSWGVERTTTPFPAPGGAPAPGPSTEVEPAPAPPGDPASAPAPGPGGGGGTAVEVITCGLPTTPPCVIDESGTPTDDGLPSVPAAVSGATAGIMACIATPSSCFPSLPALSFDFAMPTACGVIPVPAFAPFLSEVDICQFQPVFHDLMSVVWVLGGLFGAISMFWRKTFAGV